MILRYFNKFIDFLHTWWMRFARALGFVNSHLILGLFYIVIIGIYAFFSRGATFIRKSKEQDTFWIRKEHSLTLTDLERQF